MASITSKVSTATADGRSAIQVASDPGIIRVFVPGKADTSARSAARSVACKIHGSIAVGRNPEAVPTKSGKTAGHTWSFAPVTVTKSSRRTTKSSGTAKVTRKVAPKATDGADSFAALSVELDGLTAHLRDLQERIASFAGGHLPVEDMPKASVKLTRTEPKAQRELPEWLVKDEPNCTKCRDFGVVRGIGPKAGEPYKTLGGAEAATAAGHSVACTGKAHRKSRKSA